MLDVVNKPLQDDRKQLYSEGLSTGDAVGYTASDKTDVMKT
jgi:hypothetical protein